MGLPCDAGKPVSHLREEKTTLLAALLACRLVKRNEADAASSTDGGRAPRITKPISVASRGQEEEHQDEARWRRAVA